jgi:hypothetical protein
MPMQAGGREGDLEPVLRIRILDPMTFLPLDPGWVKSRIRVQDPDPG